MLLVPGFWSSGVLGFRGSGYEGYEGRSELSVLAIFTSFGTSRLVIGAPIGTFRTVRTPDPRTSELRNPGAPEPRRHLTRMSCVVRVPVVSVTATALAASSRRNSALYHSPG